MGRHDRSVSMQYATVDGTRREPFLKGKGVCPVCQGEVVAKCGPIVVQHWAHLPNHQCDPWWENETPWHRDWKNRYPEKCREVIHTALDGEIHRADVKTTNGIVIEFQHSSISSEERLSREKFYDNLVWVVDGSSFMDNFDIFHMLPDPLSEIAKDIVWFKGSREAQGGASGMFWRISENPQHESDPDGLVRIHSFHEIKGEVEDAYNGHHQYDWIRPHKTWLQSTCPVYIDFGKDYLVRLEKYGNYQLSCVRLISKRKFAHDTMIEKDARAIATRFYPINQVGHND